MISLKELQPLVSRELALIEEPGRRAALSEILVSPRAEERGWDYGPPGQRYSYWVVAEAPACGIILVHADQGFGPDFPWGFLFTGRPDRASLGNDAQWNWYLEEAFVRSGLWTGPTPPGLSEAFHLSPEERFGGCRSGDG